MPKIMTDQTQNQPSQNPADETVEVQDLGQFFGLLTAWHDKQVKTVEHFLQITEGSDVTLGEVTVKLEGEKKDAFIAGVTLSLQLLGKLPFTPIVEEGTSNESAA